MTEQAPIAQRLRDLRRAIDEVRRELGGGAIFDLAPLEQEIRKACREIDDLPHEEGRRHLPDLRGLFEALGQLAQMVVRNLQALGGGPAEGGPGPDRPNKAELR